MLRIEEIAKDAQITGPVPNEVVKVVNVKEIRHELHQKSQVRAGCSGQRQRRIGELRPDAIHPGARLGRSEQES